MPTPTLEHLALSSHKLQWAAIEKLGADLSKRAILLMERIYSRLEQGSIDRILKYLFLLLLLRLLCIVSPKNWDQLGKIVKLEPQVAHG